MDDYDTCRLRINKYRRKDKNTKGGQLALLLAGSPLAGLKLVVYGARLLLVGQP